MGETYDVVVIGSGPGGYVAAIAAAQLGLKVACVEKHSALGGTCLNVGCIPSKTLLHSSELYWHLLHHTKENGIDASSRLQFPQMMTRKEKIVASFDLGIRGLFKKNKITPYQGTATLTSATRIAIEGKEEIEAKNIILATGSEPISLPFLPFDEKRVLSSTGALSLSKVPSSMIVIGAGVIGVELGSVYSRLGTKVNFVEFLPKICPMLDESISKELQTLLEGQGMQFSLSSKVTSANISEEMLWLKIEKADKTSLEMKAEVVLVSIGRRPYLQHLGIEKLGIATTNKGLIQVDGSFRTSQPTIFAIGDIIDGPMLAHKASEEGVAVAEIIAGHHPKVDYIAVPNVVYTHPEVASVGLNTEEAKAAGIDIKSGTFSFRANSRARCMGEEQGFVKVLAEAKTDRVIGIHILSASASELIAIGSITIQQKMTAKELASIPFAHPTLSEAIKEAALAVDGRAIHK